MSGLVTYNGPSPAVRVQLSDGTVQVCNRGNSITVPDADATSLMAEGNWSAADGATALLQPPPASPTYDLVKQRSSDGALVAGVNNTTVDSIPGDKWKQSVKAGSVVNHTLTAAGSRTVDGYSCAAGDRVLLLAQTAGAENGIYTVGSDFSLTRSSDADTASELAGAVVRVEAGSTNADKVFGLNTDGFTLGTTSLTWAQISGSGSGGSGASLTSRTAVKTANYTAAAGEIVPCDVTSGGFTVTLPAAPADKTQVAVKRILPTTATANLVTVACGGSDTINRTGGVTSTSLTLAGQSTVVQYDLASATWTILATDLALSQLDARYAAFGSVGTQGPAGPDFRGNHTLLVPVTSELTYPNNDAPTGGNSRTASSCTYLKRHRVLLDSTGITFTFVNAAFPSGSSNEGTYTGQGVLTVSASIITPDGVLTRCTFGGAGNYSTTIAVGATVETDPIAGVVLDKDTIIQSVTYVSTAGTAGSWPAVGWSGEGVTDKSGEEGYNSGTDSSATGAITNGTGTDSIQPFCPTSINGLTDHAARTVALWGDSIPTGTGLTGSQAKYNFVSRALSLGDSNVPVLMLTRAGGTLTSTETIRKVLAQRCTDHLVQLGVNEVLAGNTLSQIQVKMLAFWTARRSSAGAKRVYQTTITPTTNGANVVNSAQNAVRVPLNNWLRAGAPIDPTTLAAVAVGTSGALLAGASSHPLTDFIEVADYVETARDSGQWTAAALGDGTHPSVAGHIAAARGIDPTDFGGDIPTKNIRSNRARANGWYVQPHATQTTLVPSNNGTNQVANLVPMDIKDRDLLVDGLGIRVTTAGTTGCVIRLAIYASAADGLPAALVKDFGTVAADAPNFYSITLTSAVRLKANKRYYRCLILEGAGGVYPATKPVLQVGTGAWSDPPQYSSASANQMNTGIINGYTAFTGVAAGAAPATFTGASSVDGVASSPLITYRVAQSST